MANPAAATVYGVGSAVSSGYPVFATSDGVTMVTPTGDYKWNGTAWVPAAGDSSGNTLVSLTGSNNTVNGGQVKTTLYNSLGNEAAITTTNDSLSATSYGLTAGSYQLAFDAQNGVWNRWRNNQQGTLLASAARTTTTIASNQTNYNAKGVQIIIHVTVAGTGQLSPIIQAISPVTGSNYSLEAFPVITASGSYILELYPYSATAPTGSIISKRVSGVIPRSWTLAMGHSDSSSWTYSVGYSLII